MARTTNRVALITGANKGIGREVARRLGTLGMTVLLGARDEGRGAEAARELKEEGIDARFVHLDVTEEASAERAARRIEQEFGRLDVLVNNAGIMLEEERPTTDVSPAEITPDQMRRTYEPNVLGVVTVTHTMLPLLRRSSAARLVNVSSALGSVTLRADLDHPMSGRRLMAYGSSKAALNALTLIYANELRGEGILVNAATPGFVATDLNDRTGGGTVEQGATVVVRAATLGDDGPSGAFFGEGGAVPW